MSSRIAVVAGATGLTGNYLLNELLADDYYSTVRILLRHPVSLEHPKLEKKWVDFSEADSLLVAISGAHTLFCAIGTTTKKVKGDKNLYKSIDYDIPVTLARMGKLEGCKNYILVSAIGANPGSPNFYLKLKGETENAVIASGIPSIHIMRPSMLTGDRKEHRSGEKIINMVMKILSPLVPRKYKAIPAAKVAQTMLAVSKTNTPGIHYYTYSDFVK